VSSTPDATNQGLH